MKVKRNETAAEKLDRNWSELLQELRVTQTGVQILSGFLLTLPFQSHFGVLNGTQRVIYLFAVGASVLATALLIAPVSAHRILFRHHAKDSLVAAGSLLAQLGLLALGMSVVAVVTLVFSVVAGTLAALVMAPVTAIVFATTWLALPWSLDYSAEESPDSAGQDSDGQNSEGQDE